MSPLTPTGTTLELGVMVVGFLIILGLALAATWALGGCEDL